MNKIKKRWIYILVFVVALVDILIFFSAKNSNGGIVVFKMKGPIKIDGFGYTPSLKCSSYEPSKISFSDITILQLPKKVKDNNGVEKSSIFYSLSCKVNLSDGSRKIQFLFKGTGDQFFKPDDNKQSMNNLILRYGNIEMFEGGCYSVDTEKPVNNYDFLIAPDFSSATFLVNPSGQASFRFNSFFQIANRKLISGISLLKLSPDSNLDTKVFFFENGVTYRQYISAIRKGPIPEMLRKKLGRYPTNEEIIDYIRQQLNNKP